MINGTVLEADNLSGLKSIRHGFFTREGGVSGGEYSSLNVGLGSDDNREHVVENRRRIANHLDAHADGEPLSDIVTNYQVHSAKALVIDAPHASGATPRADALVTNTPGLAIGALSADCTPVLFADPQAGIVGAAHAGWRGAVAGILTSTLNAMIRLGAVRSQVRVAIGPTISQANYEVGPEFKAQFLEQAPGNARFFQIPPGGERDHFDLPGYCRHQLMELGLSNVEDLGRCTYKEESLFYSYRRKTHRREADYGRHIAAIVVS